MCQHGKTINLQVRSKTGGNIYTAPIDECIAPLIKKLQNEGRITCSSCCGHGKWGGWVQWEDQSYSAINNLDVRHSPLSDEWYKFERKSAWWSMYDEFKDEPAFMNMKLSGLFVPVLYSFITRNFDWIRQCLKR